MGNIQQKESPTYDKSKFRNQTRLNYSEGRYQTPHKNKNENHSQLNYTDNNAQLSTNNQQRSRTSSPINNYDQNKIATSYYNNNQYQQQPNNNKSSNNSYAANATTFIHNNSLQQKSTPFNNNNSNQQNSTPITHNNSNQPITTNTQQQQSYSNNIPTTSASPNNNSQPLPQASMSKNIIQAIQNKSIFDFNSFNQTKPDIINQAVRTQLNNLNSQINNNNKQRIFHIDGVSDPIEGKALLGSLCEAGPPMISLCHFLRFTIFLSNINLLI